MPLPERLVLFLDTLGIHPDFYTVWVPINPDAEPPF